VNDERGRDSTQTSQLRQICSSVAQAIARRKGSRFPVLFSMLVRQLEGWSPADSHFSRQASLTKQELVLERHCKTALTVMFGL